MHNLLPHDFNSTFAGCLIVISLIPLFFSYFLPLRELSLKLVGILLVSSLTIFSNAWQNYFAAIFIIATIWMRSQKSSS